MKITSYPSPERYGICTIHINDEPWKDFHISIFGKKITIEAQTIQEFEFQFQTLEIKNTKKFILKKLASKNYNSFELKKILQERLISEKTITLILSELTELGFINDQEWISLFIISQKNRKKGPKRIIHKLKEKGIPLDYIENFKDEIEDKDAQIQAIQKIINKYKLSDPKLKQKAIQALIRKGFSYNIIREIIH